MTDPDPVHQRLQDWRRRLEDVGRDDRLLQFRPEAGEALVLEAPWFDEAFSALHGGDRLLRVPGDLRLRTPGSESVEATLARLHARARDAYEDAGLHVLHLAIGVLQWREAGEDRLSPLLLVPVEVLREGRRGPYCLRYGSGEPALNPALVLHLGRAFGVPLPGLPADWSAMPPSAFLATLAAALPATVFLVHPDAYLSLFRVARLRLAEDLVAREAAILAHPVVRALAGEAADAVLAGALPGAAEIDKADPRKTYSVVDADGGQLAVIEAVKRGRLLTVVDGPPGTGKSQTITNLAAEAVAGGLSVLVLSDKPAALEVVRSRLAGAGLGGYCLALHAGTASGRRVARELQEAAAVEPQASMGDAEYDRLARVRAGLNEYVQELRETRWPLDRSVGDVLGELAGLHGAPRLRWMPLAAELLTHESFEEILDLAARVSRLWPLALQDDLPWEGCIDGRTGDEAREHWSRLLEEAARETQALIDVSADVARSRGLPPPASPAEIARVLAIDGLLRREPPLPRRWLTELDVAAARAEAESWRQEAEAHRTAAAALRTGFLPELFELPETAPEDLEAAAQRAEALLGSEPGAIAESRGALRDWLAGSIASLPAWKVQAGRLASFLRLRTFRASMEESFRVARVALLLGRPERPLPEWLDRRACDRVEAGIRELESFYTHYKDRRRAIAGLYSEDVIALDDVDGMIERFGGSYQGAMRGLRPGYHRDLSRLRALRHDHQPPANPLADLRLIKAYKAAAGRLEPLRKKYQRLLGAYDTGPDGSLAAARKALANARYVLDLVSDAGELEAFAEVLRAADVPADLVVDAADLEKSLGANRVLMNLAQGALPPGPVRGCGEPIPRLPLGRLEPWLDEVGAALEGFAGQLDRVQSLVALPGTALSYEGARDALAQLASVRAIERKLRESADHLHRSYGAAFRGLETDWMSLIEALERAEEVRRRFGQGAMPQAFLERTTLPEGSPDPELCRTLLASVTGLLERLAQGFEQPHSGRRHPVDERDHWRAIRAQLETLASRLDERLDSVELSRIRHEFQERDLEPLLLELRALEVPAEALEDAVRRALLAAWYESQRAESLALREFRGEDHEALAAEFRRLDRRQWEQGAGRVVAAARAAWEASGAGGEEEAAFLAGKPDKSRGQPTLRRLFEQFPRLLKRLKPVVLGSPASAALLPPGTLFDLAVIDEASRLSVEEAVAGLSRGARVVVFGDAEQLPPHDPGASLLEALAAAETPRARLVWHHGSTDEALTAFSNARFYGRQLVTVPSPKASDSPGLRLDFVAEVNRGPGTAEAERVAALVREHLRRRPDRSLGAVAFGAAQRDAIRDAVDRMLDESPELERVLRDDLLGGFFVKEAASVQGDERDVVILSLGCARDGRGEVRLGPLHEPQGGRLLNVAITRAREELVVVTSLRSSDIPLDATAPEGLRLLRDYLEYAERGVAALPAPEGPAFRAPATRLQEDVAAALQALGYDAVRPGSGRCPVDLGVHDPKRPQRFLLGILCDDGPEYAGATARDRERLRQEVPEGVGWKIHRIWSPDWFAARETEIERLRQALRETKERGVRVGSGAAEQPVATVWERAGAPKDRPLAIEKRERAEDERKGPAAEAAATTAVAEPAKAQPTSRPAAEAATTHAAASLAIPPGGLHDTPPEVMVYEPARLGEATLPAASFHDPKNRERLAELLREVVAAEGPVHRELAARRLVAVCGVGRRNSRVSHAIDHAARMAAHRGWFHERGSFLYPPGAARATRVRGTRAGEEGSQREPAHVPPDEIGLAAELVLRGLPGLERKKLLARLGQIFGFGPVKGKVHSLLDAALSEDVAEGRLVVDGKIVRLPRGLKRGNGK